MLCSGSGRGRTIQHPEISHHRTMPQTRQVHYHDTVAHGHSRARGMRIRRMMRQRVTAMCWDNAGEGACSFIKSLTRKGYVYIEHTSRRRHGRGMRIHCVYTPRRCRRRGMSSKRHVVEEACRRRGMSSKRHVFKEACRRKGMSSRGMSSNRTSKRHVVKTMPWRKNIQSQDAVANDACSNTKKMTWEGQAHTLKRYAWEEACSTSVKTMPRNGRGMFSCHNGVTEEEC